MEIKKNPDLDNERIKLPLIFLGFFIVGSLIMLAFAYESPALVQGVDRDGRDKGDIPEEMVVVEQPEPDEPVVQEITPPEIPPPPSEEIVEEESKDEDEQIVVETPPIEIIEEPEPEPEAPIVEFPDQEAEFPGGIAAMRKFLAEKIKYPDIAIEMGDQGKVFVQFVVEKDGSISQVEVIRGVSKELDREAKRVVRQMPPWQPAETRGEKQRSRMRIPINFELN